MDKFLKDLDQLLLKFGIEGFTFTGADPLLLITLLISFLAFLLAAFAFLRSGSRSRAIASPNNVVQRLDELNVIVDDLRGLRADIDNRLSRLESQASGLEKKKPELNKQDSLPPKVTLASGLSKTRSSFVGKLRSLFVSGTAVDSATLESLEELLISSDIGVKTSNHLLDEIRSSAAGERFDSQEAEQLLRDRIQEILHDPESSSLSSEKVSGKPRIILFVGVNGVGKTTTIGKIAQQFQNRGSKVLLGACDTFRAAAVEQLKIWSERSGVDVVSGDNGAKPTTVAYETVHKALGEDYDVALIDTAGRLHTRKNLMSELIAIKAIIERELPGAPHDIVLVVDATTGQNALQQAKEFNEAVNLSGVVVTKLDGTPKGGIIVAIRNELNIPIKYIGVGEGIHDLQAFNASNFCDSLFDAEIDESSPSEQSGNSKAVRGRARRTRRAS